MRIISKFKDYYDSAQAYGSDPNIVYVRHTSEVWLPVKQLPGLPRGCPSLRADWEHGRFFNIAPIVFCGHLYLGVGSTLSGKTMYFAITEQGLSAFRKHVNSYEGMWKSEVLNQLNAPINNWSFNFSVTYARLEKLLETYNPKALEPKPELHKFTEVPCYQIVGKEKHINDVWCAQVILNPNLSHTYMPSFLDSWSAYQELEMFLGNFMLGENNAPQITDDKVLRDAKGFDSMSFKKYPTKHK